ncbi:MAG: phosphoglycerate dehydrogenase [Proteobacteria bacterium]|nr:phosphoglycerate dehydrogenase [Pseudomonadota bacterium]
MFNISTLNQISVKGLERFPRTDYEVASEQINPDAILVRSTKITPDDLNENLRGIARAGAGTDKICVDECTKKGITVFNTPGANANSVKELVTLALLLSTRGVVQGVQYVSDLGKSETDPQVIAKAIEAGKKKYAGSELKGKSLGVVGLGAIGSLVAEVALAMEMNVVGFDPGLSVDAAWRLSNKVRSAENLPTLLGKSDFVTLHLPMLETTKYMINEDTLSHFKEGAVLLNFSREGIVDPKAVEKALDSGRLSKFVADFGYVNLISRSDVILMPHLGASTAEAEENCAVMAADQLIDFLENGNIKNSVNFPPVHLERKGEHRLAFSNKNIPNMLGQVLALLAENHVNVLDMINRSRDEMAYSLIEVESEIPENLIEQIGEIEGIYAVWQH